MLVKDPTTGLMRIERGPIEAKYLDNGKVKIGVAYTPKPVPMSNESVRMQGVLLGIRPDFLSSRFALFLYALLIGLCVWGVAAAAK